jgi:hypothetical protein
MRGRRHPHPTRPGSATDTPTDQRASSAASPVPQGLLGRRPSRPTMRPPQGPRPVAVVTVACRLDLVPTSPPEVGGDGRDRPDGGGQQTAGRRTGGHQTAGRWIPDDEPRRPDTGRTGHRASRTAGLRTTEPDGGTPHAGHRRPRPWLASWHCREWRRCPTAGCPLEARLGRRVWAINNQDRSSKDYEAITLLPTGLDHRHDRQLLGRFAGQAAPRRTAVLRRFRVEGRAAGSRSSVMASRSAACWKRQ